MKFVARARNVRFSPFKMRPLVNAVRGKNAFTALNWLSTCAVKRATPIYKLIESAMGNAKNLGDSNADLLFIKEIRVDQGPVIRYFKPGAMGRSNIYKKRMCHMSVILESFDTKKD